MSLLNFESVTCSDEFKILIILLKKLLKIFGNITTSTTFTTSFNSMAVPILSTTLLRRDFRQVLKTFNHNLRWWNFRKLQEANIHVIMMESFVKLKLLKAFLTTTIEHSDSKLNERP